MLRIAALSLIASLCGPASASNLCTLDNNFCVPFVGCAVDGATFYVGRTFGREAGPLEATAHDGTVCRGTWKRTTLGAGQATFTCSDGVSGRARYTYFHRQSGTATGRGRTKAGDRLRFWAGHRVQEYVLSGAEANHEMIDCVGRALQSLK